MATGIQVGPNAAPYLASKRIALGQAMITPLPDEPERAFALFKAYVEMGEDRSIRKLVKQLKVAFDRVKHNSKRFNWQKRLSDHILSEQQRQNDAEAKAKLTVATENERRKSKIQEDAWAAGQEAIQVGRNTLRQIIKKWQTTPDAALTKVNDAARLLQVGDALCRLASGLPVGRQEITGTDGRPLIPIAPPIITVIHQFDKQSKEVERIQKQFIADHPDDPAVRGLNGGASTNGQ